MVYLSCLFNIRLFLVQTCSCKCFDIVLCMYDFQGSSESLLSAQKQISDLTRKLTDYEQLIETSRKENAKFQEQIVKLQCDIKEVVLSPCSPLVHFFFSS